VEPISPLKKYPWSRKVLARCHFRCEEPGFRLAAHSRGRLGHTLFNGLLWTAMQRSYLARGRRAVQTRVLQEGWLLGAVMLPSAPTCSGTHLFVPSRFCAPKPRNRPYPRPRKKSPACHEDEPLVMQGVRVWSATCVQGDRLWCRRGSPAWLWRHRLCDVPPGWPFRTRPSREAGSRLTYVDSRWCAAYAVSF